MRGASLIELLGFSGGSLARLVELKNSEAFYFCVYFRSLKPSNSTNSSPTNGE